MSNTSTVRVGVDVVAVDRVRRLAADSAAARRLFTDRERAYCVGKRHAAPHLAARFAAKEAVLKAFGTGLAAGMRWTDVEVVIGAHGRPRIELHGRVAAWARERSLQDLDVSLTHDAGLAVAQAVSVWGRAL